jgi:hypothetical protein
MFLVSIKEGYKEKDGKYVNKEYVQIVKMGY